MSVSNGMTFSRKGVFLARYRNLYKIRRLIRKAAEDAGFTDFEVYRIQLAVDEACSNIIEHAYGGESQNEIICSCIANDQDFIIQLVDFGIPFNPTVIPNPNTNAALEDREQGGLGLYFMHQLMDDVNFHFSLGDQTQKSGNKLTMVKRKRKSQ